MAKGSMPPRGKPEVVVITGASAGVGRATARAFACTRRERRLCSPAARKGWKARRGTF